MFLLLSTTITCLNRYIYIKTYNSDRRKYMKHRLSQRILAQHFLGALIHGITASAGARSASQGIKLAKHLILTQ
jgi:hypothetical protein